MIFLIEALEKFFENETSLSKFKDEYKELMINNVINFKKEKLIGTYKRNVLYRADEFEIILISWGAKSSTPIHCHPENGCLLYVLSGELFEYIYDYQDELTKVNYIIKGDVGYMHRNLGKHKVVNDNNKTCYSLHIYSPPNYYNK